MIRFHGQKNVLIIPKIKRIAEIKTRSQRIISLTFIGIPKKLLFSIRQTERQLYISFSTFLSQTQ